MTLQMSVTFNTQAFLASLTELERSQFPYAVATACTDTGKKRVIPGVSRRMSEDLDRPSPFSKKSMVLRHWGDKKDFRRMGRTRATVAVKRIQASYLGVNITGGTQRPNPETRSHTLAMPKFKNIPGGRVDKYGNLKRKTLKKYAIRPDVFSGKPNTRGGGKGWPGLYQRVKGRGRSRGGFKLLAAYEMSFKYRPAWGFHEHAAEIAQKDFPRILAVKLRHAVRTAKAKKR